MLTRMHCRIFVCWLFFLFAIPVNAIAAEKAKIIYLYQDALSPADGVELVNKDFLSLYRRLSSLDTSYPALVFQNLSRASDLVVLFQNIHDNDRSRLYKPNELDQGYNELDGQDAFVLNSALLTGIERLNVTESSFVVISHVDADPKLRELYPPLFNQLKSELKAKPGFLDVQVWTWDQRPNHWTLIQVWQSETDHGKALEDSGLQKAFSKLYQHTASPKNIGFYRLIHQDQ